MEFQHLSNTWYIIHKIQSKIQTKGKLTIKSCGISNRKLTTHVSDVGASFTCGWDFDPYVILDWKL